MQAKASTFLGTATLSIVNSATKLSKSSNLILCENFSRWYNLIINFRLQWFTTPAYMTSCVFKAPTGLVTARYPKAETLANPHPAIGYIRCCKRLTSSYAQPMQKCLMSLCLPPGFRFQNIVHGISCQ
jgi:hypothetical protein